MLDLCCRVRLRAFPNSDGELPAWQKAASQSVDTHLGWSREERHLDPCSRHPCQLSKHLPLPRFSESSPRIWNVFKWNLSKTWYVSLFFFEKFTFSEFCGFFLDRLKTMKFRCQATEKRLTLKKDLLLLQWKVFPFILQYLLSSHILILVSVHLFSGNHQPLLVINYWFQSICSTQQRQHKT